MPAYVASLTASLDDQVSAGAAAAAAALGKMADAADAATASTDNTTASVTKAGASANALAKQFDPATAAAASLTAAQNKLASAQETMSAAVANGSKTQAQADAVTDALGARVRSAQAAVDQLGVSSSATAKQVSGMADANAEAGVQAGVAAEGHAGFYREIVILGHEVITGNFSRIPGSLVVLAERSGQLEPIMKGVVSVVTSAAGIFAITATAGVAAFTAIAVSTNNAQNQMLSLQDQIRATHDDYVNLASVGQTAARGAAQSTPGLSLADSKTISATLLTNPNFSGTEADLQSLTVLAADMGKAFDETAVKAATDLSNAMTAPGDAAEKLVGHLSSMNQSLADSINLQAESGDKAGAFGRVITALDQQVSGDANNVGELSQAWISLSKAFDDAMNAGSAGSKGMSSDIEHMAAQIVTFVGNAITALQKLQAIVYGPIFTNDANSNEPAWAQSLLGNTQPSGPNLASGFPDSSLPATLNSTGRGLGMTSDQLELAQAIALQESGGRQFSADGSVLTSSAGALGAMQVLPSTAAQYGQDPTTAAGNISAGEQQLIHLWTKYNGDQTLVAIAYNMGEGATDKWIAAGANPYSLPGETAAYAPSVIERTKGTYTDASASASVAAQSDGSGAVTNGGQSVIDQALKQDTGTIGDTNAKLQAQIDLNKSAMTAMQAAGVVTDAQAASYQKLQDAIDAETLALSNSQDPLDKLDTSLQRQISTQNQLAAGYAQGQAGAEKATAYTQAQAEAYATVGDKSNDLAAVTNSLAAQYERLAQAQGSVQVAQQTLQNSDQLDYINAETSALGMTNEARAALLDHLKAEQDLEAKNVPIQSDVAQKYLASADAVSQATSALAKQQQTISDVESLSTQVFDQVGSSITQAFTTGGKSALDFGSIFKSVMASVAQEVLKLAVLNPVLNSLFGGSRTTLSDVGGLLSGFGGGSGGVTMNADGSYSQVIGTGTVGGGSYTSNAVGGVSSLGGLGNLFSGLSGSIDNLGSSLFGLDSVSSFGAAGSGIAGPSWDAAITGSSGASLSGLLGGAGLGFGAGSLLNSLDGGSSLGGTLGSGAGSLAGAAIGSIIPGVGTLIGGLLGGLAGGGIGGLFGNSKPSDKGEYAQSKFTDGQAGAVTAAGVSSGSEFSSANSTAAQALATNIIGASQAIIANFGGSFGGALGGGGLNTKVGSRDGIGAQVEGQAWVYAADTAAGAKTVSGTIVGEIVAGLHDNLAPQVNTILNSIDYTNLTTATQQINQLGGLLTNGQLDAQEQIAAPNINFSDPTSALASLDFVKNTYEPATDALTGGGSIAAQIKSVQDNYTSIITQAKTLGLATDTLLTGETSAIQQINDAAAATLADNTVNLQVSGLKAQAVIANDGTPAGASAANALNEQADLQAFDQQAADATTALAAQLTAAYGNGYKTTAAYAQQMTLLDTTQAQQRLAIQAQYNQQAIALTASQTSAAQSAAASVVSSLTSYVTGLQTSSASPLNAKAQYQLAAQQYQADLVKAQAGDATSIGNLQGYASSFLSASQNVYGSGAAYASDFSSVVSALGTIAGTAQDALTQDFMTLQFQDLRDTLSADLAGLQVAVNGVKAEIMLQGAKP